MKILIQPRGVLRWIYDESLDLWELGRPVIERASCVEPDADGRWLADLSPVNGPVLGPFEKRSEALAAEVAWLEQHLFEDRR